MVLRGIVHPASRLGILIEGAIGRPQDAVGLIDFTEGGRMTGYDLRLHGCGRTGEVNLDPGREAREQAHASEDSLPPEADQLPVWMGIATEVGFPPGLHDPDDSTSDGSFCKVDCG